MVGNIEFEIDGVTRGFRFGTWAVNIISKESGERDIKKIFQKIQGYEVKNEKGEVIERVHPDTDMILTFFFGCASHYADHKKQKVDFRPVDVADWLDELGLEKINEMTLQLFDMYIPKNSNPPVMTGEKIES